MAKSKLSDSLKQILIMVVIFGVIALLASSDSHSNPSTTSEYETGDSGRVSDDKVFVISNSFMKRFLKSPSTADFPISGNVEELSDNEYKVSSYVDSQNSFGGTVRNNYTMKLEYNGGNWSSSNNWSLKRLVVDGKVVYPK